MSIVPDGAAASGHHGLHLAGNLNTPGAVTITLPENRGVLRMHVLGLAYTSPDTAESRWLAQIQDSPGVLLPPNEVLYPNALAGDGGVFASVRYKYGRWGAEQDVLIGPDSNLPPPRKLGMNDETVLLEVWSEIFDGPEPVKTSRVLDGLTDWTLDYGTMRMTRGSAFALDAPMNRKSGAPVHKTLLKSGGRTFLIESVRYKAIRSELERLGALQAAGPGNRVEKTSRLALLNHSRAPSATVSASVQMAFDRKAFDTRNTLAIDWVLYTGNSSNVTFAADSTALISGVCNFFGKTIFEGSAVLKFTATNDAVIQCFSNVTFNSDHYRPVIFTSRQDRSIGEDLYLAGAATNYFQALACSEPDQEFKHLRISYANYGLHTYSMQLRHAQFLHCGFALYTENTKWYGSGAEVDNVLFYDVVTAFGGGYYDTAVRHVTVNRCGTLASDWGNDPAYPSSLAFTNSLLVSVTNLGSVSFTTNYTVAQTSFVFHVLGSGLHYLPSSSGLHAAGTTNIPLWLATDLRLRTTYAPTVISNVTLATNIALVQRVPRGGAIPDIGFAYAPLDTVYGGNTLTNATLNLYAGAVLGTFTPGSNTHGLMLSGGASMVAEGTPRQPVRIVRYNLVQEQANTNWMSIYPGASVRIPTGPLTPAPAGSFRFTEWVVPGLEPLHFDGRTSNTTSIVFRDCQFTGGKIRSAGVQVAFTNCLFNRVDSHCDEYPYYLTNRWYNNTLYGGRLGFYNTVCGPWEIFNNLFYNTTDLTTDCGGLQQGWNAYLPGASIINYTDTNNGIVTNIVFQTGPLGDFYLTNTSPLINRGKTNANLYGLSWHTITKDQRLETNSTIDIGFHYIGLASTNWDAPPLDRDGDGLADYQEDANGNGVQDVGETSVTRADSPFVPDDYEPLGPSSRRTPLVISEIMYNPPTGQNEFIELCNTHHLAQDVSGFQIEVPGDQVFIHTFPPNTVLQPQIFLVVTLTNRLDNGGGTIRLRNRMGAVLLNAEYSDSDPWTVKADGTGHSLVLSRPSYGENDPKAWTASDRISGSPGYAETNRADRLRAISINEFLADPAGGQNDYIELYNHSHEPIDILGCYLSDSKGNLQKFTNSLVPAIPPRGFVLFTNGQFSFGLPAGGNADVLLASPDATRVLDVIHYEGQSNGVSMGRSPDGADSILALADPTPGRTNNGVLPSNIIISEVMFNPISGDNDQEFIELHNRGAAAANVTNWQISGVGTFTIPTGTPAIPADGYLVISRSNATLRTLYPNLDNNNSVGDYPGTLDNRRQKLTLTRPRSSGSRVVMHELTYEDGGRWGQWSDGKGSSLELVDHHTDTRYVANWADSAAPTTNAWVSIQIAARVQLGDANPVNAIEISLMDAGECLVDDVQVIPSGGGNLVNNSTFANTNNWALEGNHYLSTITNGSMHLRADGRGDYLGNRVWGSFSSSLASNTLTTISANVRWLRGSPEILLRLRGNGLELAAHLSGPTNLGTPTAPNSMGVANAGPAITKIMHQPAVPLANELVLISARIIDPNGVTNVTLNYRLDPAATVYSVTMRDDGTSGDAWAGDGIFSATLGGQTAGRLVAFRVEAADSLGMTSRFPTEREMYPGDTERRECLVRFGDPQKASSFGIYRLWMTQATADKWATRSRAQINNYGLDMTFVYGNDRVIYNATAAFSGSDNTSSTYNSPTNTLCGYGMTFPTDDRFLGASDVLFDWPFRDQTGQREQMAYWMAQELGIQVNYRRHMHLYVNGRAPEERPNVNGVETARIYEDAQAPGGDYLEEWFPADAEGDLYKLQVWRQGYEFPVPGNAGQQHATLRNLTNSTGKNLPSYRWNWRRRAVQDSAHNYTNLYALVHAFNTYTNYIADLEAVADIEQWARVFAANRIVGNLDVYQNLNGHNMYAYKPQASRWNLLLYDLDLIMGETSDSTSTSLFSTNSVPNFTDPRLIELLQTNYFRRAYWRAFQDAVSGPMQSSRYGPVADTNYATLLSNGVKLYGGVTDVQAPGSSAGFKTWLDGRRGYINGELDKLACGFAITNNGGNNFTTNTSSVLLAGQAPPQVKLIAFNSVLTNVIWHTVTNWSLSVTLSNGANSFTVQGYDRFTNTLSGTNANIIITKY